MLLKIKKNIKLVLAFVMAVSAFFPVFSVDVGDEPDVNSKRNVTGWVDSSGRDIDARFGYIRLRCKPKLGTFNISVINKLGKSIPVINSSNEYTTSSIFLKVNENQYKLTGEGGVKVYAQRTNSGLKILYELTNVADVMLNLECFQSASDTDYDMIKASIRVTNRSSKKQEFAIKTLLDTVLGEADRYHFYTIQDVPVTSETIYHTMANERLILSKNSLAAAQFIFNGAGATDIESLCLANYGTLQKKSWEMEVSGQKSFDTVTNYNNSALACVWPSVRLSPSASDTVVFYMAFAADGKNPNGLAYIKPVKTEEKVVKNIQTVPIHVPEPVNEVKVNEENIENNIDNKFENASTAVEINQSEEALVKNFTEDNTLETKSEVSTDSVDKSKKSGKENIQVPANQPKPNVKFDVSKISQEQLSPAYIQNLIDRIVALEDSGVTVNRDELLQLNLELDAILSVLRQ